MLDNKNTLYLLDNSGDIYPFGSAVISGNKWMRNPDSKGAHEVHNQVKASLAMSLEETARVS